MYPSAGRETPQHLRHAVRVLLQCTLLACLLLPIAGFAQKTVNASATPQAKASYPAQRDRLQADLTRVRREGSQAQVAAAMAALRDLANANGDTDLAQRMEVERIFAVHDDAAIDDSLAQLNRIRAELNPEASAELQEALARVYGNLYFDVGNYGLALQHQLEALTWADKLPRDARQARLYRLSTIAELYNAMDLPEHALRYAEQAMALLDAQPDANTQKGTRISVLGARAQAYMALRQYDTAARILQQAEQLDGTSAPGFNTLRLAANRANLAIATGDAASATAAVSRLQQLAEDQATPTTRPVRNCCAGMQASSQATSTGARNCDPPSPRSRSSARWAMSSMAINAKPRPCVRARPGRRRWRRCSASRHCGSACSAASRCVASANRRRVTVPNSASNASLP